MRKLFLIPVLILAGCSYPPQPPSPWGVGTRKVTLVVTIKESDNFALCTERGGTWVKGDSKVWLNVVTGCVEPEDTPKVKEDLTGVTP